MDVNTMKKMIKTIQELKSDNRSGWAYLMIILKFSLNGYQGVNKFLVLI